MKLLNYNRIKLGKFNHFFGDPKKQSDACESESLKFGHTSGAQKRKSVSQSLVRPIFAEREEARPAISGNTIKSQIVENVRFAFLVNTTESNKIPQSCPCFVYKFVYTPKRAFSRRVHQRSSKSDIDFSFSSSTILT